jgi:iron complex transport system permease protein
MLLFAPIILVHLCFSLLMVKQLDALLLGDVYAGNLGVNVKFVRVFALVVTGALTAVVTAFCGPIAFIGLAVPHIARLSLGSNSHKWLMPAVIILGASVALMCNLICQLPGESGLLPLGAVTPLIGAPVIIYVVLRSRRGG